MSEKSSIIDEAAAVEAGHNIAYKEGCTVAWKDLNVFGYEGTKAKGPKAVVRKITKCCRPKLKEDKPRSILRGVSGIAKAGQLLAIMGASGAGKTTLLNILTERNTKGLVCDGSVLVNGHEIGSMIKSISAYVQQHDMFIGTLKVKEHLTFQALLRMDRSLSDHQRRKRVDDIIQELGLGKCEDTMIGIPGRIKGISGGEKKRLAFASEVLTNPRILFCDEPTSGLDAYMAQQVIAVLKHMAETGITVIATIHQPSSSVFRYFDSLCLLAEGRVAFMGSTDAAASFFLGCGYPCPENFNPADHYIHTLAVVPGKERECRSRIRKMVGTYAKSKYNEEMQDAILTEARGTTGMSSEYEWNEIAAKEPKYRANWFRQFRLLCWRAYKQGIREPMLTRVRAVNITLIAIIMGLVYLQTSLNALSIQSVNGLLFQFTTAMTMQFSFTSVSLFCQELPIFMREHSSRMYRTDTYYVAKILLDFPQFIIFPIIFTTILYWMADLRNDAVTFFVLLGINLLTANVAAGLSYLVSTVAGDERVATTIAPLAIIPFMLFGGFFINSASIPVFFKWLSYVSHFKYSYEAQAINYWQSVDFIPGCEGVNSTCARNGQEMLAQLNFDPDFFIWDVVILAGLAVAYRVLAYFVLLLRTLKK